MSEHNVSSSSRSDRRRRRDAGFTLPELLCSIIVLGSIVAVLSSAIIVTFKQKDNTEGRLNVSRAEQAIDTWIPADLASTDSTPSTDPWMSPCSLNLVPNVLDTSGCPPGLDLSGSNALFLSWSSQDMSLVTTTTQVSYHFTPRVGGLFDLVRIECRANDSGPSTAIGPWTCESITVLHDLPGPPPGDDPFVGGLTKPYWVLTVSVPVDPNATGTTVSGPTTTYANEKNASQVVVTFTGGGDVDGRGGGINQISITAGGTTRGTLPVKGDANAPSFTTTKSRCGGPLTLIVDESGSIGSAMPAVRAGVRSFVSSLAGTPVQIQIVRFDTTASVLGTTGWSKYYNMLDPAEVTALDTAIGGLATKSYTNWEDAWFRTFYAADGSFAPIIPQTVVFFTDGIPSWDRTANRGAPGVATPTNGPTATKQQHANGWPALDSDSWPDYNQVAFNRAEHWIQQWRGSDTRLIGVGVGDSIGTLSTTAPAASEIDLNGSGPNRASWWMDAAGAGYHAGWQERSDFTYEERSSWTWEGLYQSQSTFTPQSNVDFEQLTGWQSRLDFEEATAWQSRLDFEQATAWQSRADFEQNVSGNWTDRTPLQYYTNNVNSGSADGWRIRSTDRAWYGVTSAEYLAYQSQIPDDWQITAWADRNPTQYYTSNVNTTETDNWRINSTNRAWYGVTSAEYLAYQSQSPTNWQVPTWTDRTPTQYYTSNVNATDTDNWRINPTNRPFYTVTSAEYVAYQSQSPTNWQLLWTDRTPTQYYASNIDSTEADGWRIRTTSDRSPAWYTVTSTEYSTYNSATLGEADGYRMFGSGTWGNITKAVYDANNYTSTESDGYRNSTWASVSQSDYNTNNTTPDESDGYRRHTGTGSWVPILKPAYDASNTTYNDADGYRRLPVNTSAWLGITNAEYTARNLTSDETDGVRTAAKVYTEPALHTAWEAPVQNPRWNASILSRFITGNDTGAIPWNGTNEKDANLYVSPNWSEFDDVMKAVALGECGATLTFQTKRPDATPPGDFKYDNTALTASDGVTSLFSELTYVETTTTAPAVTFDLNIADGTARYITFVPRDEHGDAYTGGAFACKAGGVDRTITVVPATDGSPWTGIKVKVNPNEAVSCIHTVTPAP